MKARRINFDPLARCYRALEFLAFGGDLERARFCLLDHLADRKSILVLGEGDGRALAQLVTIAPQARIHSLDLSPALIAKAKARIADTPAAGRVTFECADAATHDFPPGKYDAVVTLFFLDCFNAPQAAAVVDRIATALQPNAGWLFGDFVLPPSGFARWRARIWVAVLYAFFRWSTGIQTRSLPPSEALITAAGFQRETMLEFQHGLLRSAWFRR